MTFRVGPSTLTRVLALLMVKHQPDAVLSHDLSMEEQMSCLAQLSRQKLILHWQVPGSNPKIQLHSFLGPHGPVARDACSKHAAGVCLGTILARTHVQLGLSCQQLLLRVQHRLRFTMQHVKSHSENLGNECADHAAALGAFGFVSNHNLSTRWTRHSFDSASCFATCHNIGDVLEKLRDIRTEHVSASQHQTTS